MGKRSNYVLRAKDQYFTPVEALAPLLKRFKNPMRFYEPCAGDGRLVQFMEDAGHRCTGYSDVDPTSARLLAHQSYGRVYRQDVEEMDALDLDKKDVGKADYIVTNPPWTRTKESGYLLHNLITHFSNMAPTWLLFDADWIHTVQSGPYMDRLQEIVSIGRVKWIPNSKTSGVDNSAWYLFTRPELREGDFPRFVGRQK